VASSAAANGMVAALHPRIGITAKLPYEFPPEVVVVARSAEDLAALHLGAGWQPIRPRGRTWTDDYSDILGVLLARLAQ